MPGNLLLGFGASAIGRLPQGYVQNEVGTRAYPQSIADGRLATVKGYGLTGDDRLRAEIIERIMCDFGADLEQICARHGSEPEAMLRSSASPAGSDYRRRCRTRRRFTCRDGPLTVPGSQRGCRLRRPSRWFEAAPQPRGLGVPANKIPRRLCRDKESRSQVALPFSSGWRRGCPLNSMIRLMM